MTHLSCKRKGKRSRLKSLQEIIDKGKRIVFFGGAGVSTESGIPDFRSQTGLYSAGGRMLQEGELAQIKGLTPETVLSNTFFYMHPGPFFDFYRKYMIYPDARPNAAHKKLFELEQCDKLRGIVTQNVDGLHRMAGNKRVYGLHGSIYENICMDCSKRYPLEWLMAAERIPRCEDCGGVVKPNVVLYGEGLDKYTVMGACREISSCDVLIVAGTSLTVEPAASYLAYFGGKELVIINREATRADRQATLVIRESVAQVLGAIRL